VEFLAVIAKHVDRLNAIVNDLLSLSRIEETEKKGILAEEGPVREILEGAIQTHMAKAAEKDIEIVLNCGEDIRARIDRRLVEQAVGNLIDNAIKYSEASGVIRVEATPTEQHVILSVSDDGCGIEKEHLPRLFERFYRVDKGRSRKLGGTGLGLAIVKHIAQAHGGSVSVESVPGKGSSFSIHLPKS
jgi:two-component system phosphate regulon sensor histidine kinase PhoR